MRKCKQKMVLVANGMLTIIFLVVVVGIKIASEGLATSRGTCGSKATGLEAQTTWIWLSGVKSSASLCEQQHLTR